MTFPHFLQILSDFMEEYEFFLFSIRCKLKNVLDVYHIKDFIYNCNHNSYSLSK